GSALLCKRVLPRLSYDGGSFRSSCLLSQPRDGRSVSFPRRRRCVAFAASTIFFPSGRSRRPQASAHPPVPTAIDGGGIAPFGKIRNPTTLSGGSQLSCHSALAQPNRPEND